MGIKLTSFKNKVPRITYKNLLILSVLTFLLIIILLITILYVFPKVNEVKRINFISNTEDFIKNKNGTKNPNLDLYITSIQNKESKEKSYKYLVALASNFDSEYIISKDPEIRVFANNTLLKYAENNYPDNYNSLEFRIPCSDQKCGQEIDNNLKAIINDINNNLGEIDETKIIIMNLETASYVPDDNVDSKLVGFKTVYVQLTNLGTVNATAAAEKLNEYSKFKYKYSLN